MSGRMLGYASVAMLVALRDGARYGLEIMESAGLPSGTVYPALGRMEERGLIVGLWENAAEARAEGRPRRRFYQLTAAGGRALNEALIYYASLQAGGEPEGGRS